MEALPIYNVNPGGGSLNGWETLALMNNRNGSGYGMEGGWFAWIIILLLFGWGRNGFGGGYGGSGNGCGCGCGCNSGIGVLGADLAVSNATATARNEAGLDFIAQNVNGIRNTLCDLSGTLCNQFATTNSNIAQIGYQTQLGQRDLQAQIATCCCNTQQSIAAVNNNISQQFGQLNYNNAMSACDIKNAIHAEGEATRALLNSQYTAGIERKLAEANQQLFVLRNFGQYANKGGCGCGCDTSSACGCGC
jgi:galactitol-specific phosphotransferase system IIB component